MTFDNALVAGKLRRWEGYLNSFRLPEWDNSPDIGLYMEQVVVLLRQYLDYMPPELQEDEQPITASAINNYVRTRIMPSPEKKRYYRVHIAYLIMICTLKQSLSIAMIKRIIPVGIDQSEVRQSYESFAIRHSMAAQHFVQDVKALSAVILGHEDEKSEVTAERPEDLITYAAMMGGWSALLAEKLILLEGLTIDNGGSIEIR